MNVLFVENYCRICYKFFCCIKCRIKHEENYHHVYPNCEICVYGRTILRVPSHSLITHWKAQHWPLHCLLCKKIFTTQRDINMHVKCPSTSITSGLNENPSVVSASVSDLNYDSPPITGAIYKANKQFDDCGNIVSITTSTPMNKCNERELMESIPQGITPVDYSENTASYSKAVASYTSTKSLYTPIYEETKNTESLSKRRVTFCETPFISYDKDESSLTDKKFEVFTTATEELIEENLVKKNTGSIIKNGIKEEDPSEDCCDITLPHNTALDLNILIIPSNIISEELNLVHHDLKSSTHCNKTVPVLSNSIELESKDIKSITDSIVDVFVTPDLKCNSLEDDQEKSNNFKVLKEEIAGNTSILIDNLKHETEELEVQSNKNGMDSSTEIFMTPTLQENYSLCPSFYGKDVSNSGRLVGSVTTASITEANVSHLKTNKNIGTDFQSPVQEPALEIALSFEDQTDLASGGNFFIMDKENGDPNSELVSTSVQNAASTSFATEKQGLWFSMTSIVKNAMKGLSESSRAFSKHSTTSQKPNRIKTFLQGLQESVEEPNKRSNKRSQPETETSAEETPTSKRMKLNDIKCRRTIRHLGALYLHKKRSGNVDKSTQTDCSCLSNISETIL